MMYSYRSLTDYEGLVWAAIGLKTIRYGKLLEKIPRRLFVEGEKNRDESEEPRYNESGVQGLPSTGIADRNLSKPLRGLRGKDWITDFESAPHQLYGSSTVYCPFRLQTAVQILLNNADHHIKTVGLETIRFHGDFSLRKRRIEGAMAVIRTRCDEALRIIEDRPTRQR